MFPNDDETQGKPYISVAYSNPNKPGRGSSWDMFWEEDGVSPLITAISQEIKQRVRSSKTGGAPMRRPFSGKSLKTDLQRVSKLGREELEKLGERVTRQHDRTPRFDKSTGIMPRKRVGLEELEDKIMQRSEELDAKGSLRAYTSYRKYPDPKEAKKWSDEALANALQENDSNGSYVMILEDIKSGEIKDISRKDNRETLLEYMKELWESEEDYKRSLETGGE